MAAKLRQRNLNPKKEAGNATTATTPVSVMTKLDWRELKVTEEKNNQKMQGLWKKINEQDSENYDGMRSECWDDQLTEESDSILTT